MQSSALRWSNRPIRLGLEQMSADFRRALARLDPVFMPDLLFGLIPEGEPLFQEFAAAIPTPARSTNSPA